MEPAGCNLTLQTGSCGVFLFAGSSSVSGRGVRVDEEKRELEEEEAVGERQHGTADFCCPCPGDAKGNSSCFLEPQAVLPELARIPSLKCVVGID